MKTILAPVDFSAAAENAACFAGALAEFYGAELYLYHCYNAMVPLSEYAYQFVSEEAMQKAAEDELAVFQKKVQDKLKRNINIHLKAENGKLDEGMAAYCDEIKPDLVVMGFSGKNALTRLIAGSNTIKAIQHLHYPILVVPPQAEFIPLRKIGFACDYNKVIETTPVEPLKRLIRDFNAELHVLNIEYHNQNYSQQVIKESIAISELLKELHPEYHAITAPDVTTGINWFAEKEKLDWVVVIPKKHKLVDKLFNRSNSKDLLLNTNLPVLCMHD